MARNANKEKKLLLVKLGVNVFFYVFLFDFLSNNLVCIANLIMFVPQTKLIFKVWKHIKTSNRHLTNSNPCR